MTLSEKLRLFRAIHAGCKLHPTYKAAREPKTKCRECREMWKAKQSLREVVKHG